MDTFTMVVAIVGILSVASVIERHIKAKERGQKGVSQDSLEKLTQQVQNIDERLQILEKIVTDDKYHLDKEIRNL